MGFAMGQDEHELSGFDRGVVLRAQEGLDALRAVGYEPYMMNGTVLSARLIKKGQGDDRLDQTRVYRTYFDPHAGLFRVSKRLRDAALALLKSGR